MEESQVYFYGSFESRLGPKGQVTIPARFRSLLPKEELARGFALVQGQAPCLYLYTHRQFGEIKNRARQSSVESGNKDAFRAFMEDVVAVDLDPQGRFVVPSVLRERAGLSGPDVLFVGMDDRIEIWNPATRQTMREGGGAADQWRREYGDRIFGF